MSMMRAIEALVSGILSGGGWFVMVRFRPFLGMAGPPIGGGISPDLDMVRRTASETATWRYWAARLAAVVGFCVGAGLTISQA